MMEPTGAPGDSAPSPERTSRGVHAWLIVLVFGIWLVGQLARDRFWFTGLCFYFPSPVCATVLAALALWVWRTGRGRTAIAAIFLAIAPAVFTFAVENQWHRPDAAEHAQTSRLVHWNIWYGKLGWKPLLEQMMAVEADALVLSEVLPETDLEAVAEVLGEDYTGGLAGNMAVVVRGTLGPFRSVSTSRTRAHLVSWERDGRVCRLLMVDVPSNPLKKRAPALRDLCDLIEQHQPDIVVGDFNAPRRSLALAALPDGYAHAYEKAGAGWSYSWPSFAPVLGLDQCITGPRVVPLRYDLRSTRASDHRMQILDYDWEP